MSTFFTASRKRSNASGPRIISGAWVFYFYAFIIPPSKLKKFTGDFPYRWDDIIFPIHFELLLCCPGATSHDWTLSFDSDNFQFVSI